MSEATGLEKTGQNSTRIRAKKARRRLFINLAVVLVILVAIALFWNSRRAKKSEPQGLSTATAGRRDLVQVVSATGSVTAQTGAMVKIGSQITGRIKRLYADVGSPINAGEVIAELDVPDLQANVQQAAATLTLNQARLSEQLAGVNQQDIQTRTAIDSAKAAVSVAEANLRQAQANADYSAANLGRLQQLFAKGYVAAADVDNAQAQAKVNAAQLASAKEQINQAQASLAAAQAGVAQPAIKREQVAEARATVQQSAANLAAIQAQLDKAFIRSPISGTVIQLSQQQGETIAAGLSAPTLIIVADLSRLQVDAFVDETDIGQVKLGQKAQVTVDAYPNHPFSGKVVKIASGSTLQQNVVTYDVTIALENPGGLLKPDMTASVNITVAEKNNVLAVPVDAIKQSVKGTTVTVMRQQGDQPATYEVMPVETGISDGEYTEIVKGLQDGDTIVLAGAVPGMTTDTGGGHFPSPFGIGRRGASRGGH